MEYEICQRCGKQLSNPESRRLGYGKTCYRIITLQKAKQKEEEELNEVISIVKFLRCEINMIKSQMRQMKQNGLTYIDPIEKLKQDDHRPERDANIDNMAEVMKEFKELLASVNDVKQLLTPVKFINEKPTPNIYL